MAESESWARLRGLVAQRNAPAIPPADPPDPDADAVPDDDGGEGGKGEAGEPGGERRRFRPGAIGPLLDRALPAGLVDRAARIPTPGGLFPILAALIFFLFAIVPVGASGQTRLQLVWQSLIGAVRVPPTGTSLTQQEVNAISGALQRQGKAQGIPVPPNVANSLATGTVAIQQGANPFWAEAQAVGSELLPWHYIPDAWNILSNL